MNDFGWKVNIDLSNLYNSHCLIRFNISSENNDFGFNSIKKSTLKKSHLNA